MRIFITGASGWIGSAATTEFLEQGDEVLGLVRSDASADAARRLGAKPVRGGLDDVGVIGEAAAASDAVVHLGYNHDFSRMQDAARTDAQVIDAVGDALDGTAKPFLVASGMLGLAEGRPGTERDTPAGGAHPRLANAAATLALAERGVRSMVVRFAPTVHGPGDHGFVATLVQIAREKGVSAYVGDGVSRWPAVHRLDAGRLVRLATKGAPAGSVLHAVAEEGIATRDIAEAIGSGLNLPVRAVSAEEAGEHFGWIGPFFGSDMPASAEITRELLGWTPGHPGLLEDLAGTAYFQA